MAASRSTERRETTVLPTAGAVGYAEIPSTPPTLWHPHAAFAAFAAFLSAHRILLASPIFLRPSALIGGLPHSLARMIEREGVLPFDLTKTHKLIESNFAVICLFAPSDRRL